MSIKTVLVADDEAHITHVVALKLRQAGLRVITASDGEEAYDMACEQRPDVVVTDFQMPLMSGYDLSVRLKETAQTATVPVLMITARGHMLTSEDLARTNIRSVMCKPFSPRHVLEKVKELLGPSGETKPDVGAGQPPGAVAA